MDRTLTDHILAIIGLLLLTKKKNVLKISLHSVMIEEKKILFTSY